MATALLSSANNRNGGRLLLGLLGSIELGSGARALLEPLAKTVGGRRDGEQMAAALRLVSSLGADLQKACLTGLAGSVSRGGAPVPESIDGWVVLTRFLRAVMLRSGSWQPSFQRNFRLQKATVWQQCLRRQHRLPWIQRVSWQNEASPFRFLPARLLRSCYQWPLSFWIQDSRRPFRLQR